MYIPSHFSEADTGRITQFVFSHPLAVMVANVEGQLVGNHLPFMALDDEIKIGSKLISHTAKANPIWKIGEANEPVLLIFSGYETYISPSYYPTKKETHKVVPTYNYVAIHIYGKLVCIHDQNQKHAIVEKLTREMEAPSKNPWAVADAPADYIQTMLANIVGIQLTIEKIEAKWKVSQNRPEKDKHGVIDALRNASVNANNLGMAKEIEQRSKKWFIREFEFVGFPDNRLWMPWPPYETPNEPARPLPKLTPLTYPL